VKLTQLSGVKFDPIASDEVVEDPSVTVTCTLPDGRSKTTKIVGITAHDEMAWKLLELEWQKPWQMDGRIDPQDPQHQ
jgi:hypothetical protein